MIDYKALAERIGKQADELAAFGHHTSEQRVADLRTVVSLLNGMANAEPVGWLHHVYLGDDLVDKVVLDTADPAQVPLGPNEVVRTVAPITWRIVPQPQPEKCGCRSCLTPAERLCTFVVCPECGDKRCPRADDHRNDCTSDNVPQPQPEPMPKGKPGFVQQIENSRENVKAWPQWMQDATVESAATMPKFPTPQPERQPVSEPTDAHPMLCATHYCKDCAALWRQCDDFSFTLRSQACCTACNNAPVGGQLFALTTPVAMPRPSEPTEAQIEAGVKALRDRWQQNGDGLSDHGYVECVLRAALAAKEQPK